MAISALLSSLQARLKALEAKDFERLPILSFGLAQLDEPLADRGLRLDSLHEVAGASGDLRDAAASQFFIAGIAARAWGPVLWITRPDDLFAPDYGAAGLDPQRVIRVTATRASEVAALMDAGLRHRGLGAVIGDVGAMPLATTRNLHAAAQGGHTIALLRRHHMTQMDDPLAPPSAAHTRWRIGDAASGPLARSPVGRARWSVELAAQSGGDGFVTRVAGCDRNGRCAALAAPRQPPAPRVASLGGEMPRTMDPNRRDARAALQLVRSAA